MHRDLFQLGQWMLCAAKADDGPKAQFSVDGFFERSFLMGDQYLDIAFLQKVF